MLYRTGDLAHVDVGEYLRNLTKHPNESRRIAGQSIDISVESAGIHVTVDIAVPCGLIVNELVINALKHAFPKGASGFVHVEVV
jgi:two-component sensor histidine kinase